MKLSILQPRHVRSAILAIALATTGLLAGHMLTPRPAFAHCENNGCVGLECKWMENLNCSKTPGGNCVTSPCEGET